MKWNAYLAIAGVAASLAAVPAAAHAQDRAPEARREHADSAHRRHGSARMMGARPMAGPAERLLAHRSELELTDDQVRRLEQIRDTRAAREKPYQETLRELHAERRAERREADSARSRNERREPPAEARAAMDALRASRDSARQEATAVLTEAQREKARALMAEHREHRREMREDRREDRRERRDG